MIIWPRLEWIRYPTPISLEKTRMQPKELCRLSLIIINSNHRYLSYLLKKCPSFNDKLICWRPARNSIPVGTAKKITGFSENKDENSDDVALHASSQTTFKMYDPLPVLEGAMRNPLYIPWLDTMHSMSLINLSWVLKRCPSLDLQMYIDKISKGRIEKGNLVVITLGILLSSLLLTETEQLFMRKKSYQKKNTTKMTWIMNTKYSLMNLWPKKPQTNWPPRQDEKSIEKQIYWLGLNFRWTYSGQNLDR